MQAHTQVEKSTWSDLAVPRCGRCAKARLQCSGPRDIAIFSCEGQTRAFRSVGDLHDHSISQNRTLTLVASSNRGSEIVRSIGLDQYDVFAAFTVSKLLPTQEGLSIAPGIIADEAFAALAATYFGIKQQERSIAEFGFERYSKALKTVHIALVDENQSRSDDLLEAVMIMALIEVQSLALDLDCD